MQHHAQQASVPTYKLFGEQAPWPTPEMLHCESIAARSASIPSPVLADKGNAAVPDPVSDGTILLGRSALLMTITCLPPAA